MNLLPLLKSFTVDPIQLNIKAKILSLLACFCAIFFISLFTQALNNRITRILVSALAIPFIIGIAYLGKIPFLIFSFCA